MLFTDMQGKAVTPKSLKWQLQKTSGAIINERSFANCDCTGETAVLLSGPDLATFGEHDTGKRYFAINGIYDSDEGLNIPLTDQCIFEIDKLLSQDNIS